ncbi:3'-5' RNA exonuclease complex component, partial [Coemansia sp. RSA 2049]
AAVFRSLSRLHTSTACRSDDKKYQDLDEILGKPASSFSELVDQLEILIKHPSPPRNYAEALAKEELRRIDSHDLAARSKKHSDADTDKDKTRDTNLPVSARPILRQRPRLSRQPMAVNDELYYRDQTRGLASDGSDVSGEDAQRQKPANKPLDLDARVRNFEFGIQPLSKEDAANIGITEEQQERRRIWMSKITGYREFRRNMMSVDNVLDIIDRDEAKDDDSSKEDVSVESLYDSLSEFDMHSLAVKEEDIEFENMIRKSWKLDDEDLMSDKKEETGDVPDATSELSHLPSSDSSSSSSKPPDNKRHYHTSRILGDNNRPDTKDNPSAKKPLLIHSKKIVSSHFINNAAEIDDDMMPIGMSVSSGDFIDLRLPRENFNTVNSTIHMRTGFVVQKTTGRFHFNIITAEYMLLSAREQGVGFVADGVLFDEKFLKSTGINDDDITRLIEYGKELDEFEDTHGREIVIPEIEAAQALMTTKQIDAGEAMKASGLDEISDVGELTPESGMEDSTVSVLDLKNNHQSEDTHAEEDGGESFADFMFRVVPTVSRHFKEQADALLLSHFREIKGYYRMAIRNKQKQVTVDSLARLIFGQKANSPDTKKDSDNRPSHIARFAAYMHMINDPVHYIPDVHVFYSCTFELRDPKEVKEILDAKDMVRKQSSEFKGFVEIAQKLVSFSYSHKLDSPLRRSLDADIEAIQKSLRCQITGWKHTGSLAERKIPCDPVPSRQEVDAIRFNESSQLFIRILSKYVFYKNNGYANILNPYWFVVSPILKKMGVYGNTDMASVIRFLVDIGVWPTWFSPSANIRKYPYGDFAKGTDIRRLAETAEAVSDRYLQGLESSDDKVKTNTPVPDMGGVSDIVTPVKEHALTTAVDGKRVLKASEFYDHDICKAIRHDFGDMPVYTIDSSDTRDVDDGVSIEKVKGPDGNSKMWLHIHIADPTALIHPGHIITESAMRSPQSIYIPEMTINMIPKNLLEAKLSLGSRSKGMPTYTMTFSVCLSDDGNIAEYKVQPGVVHNITAVPYDVLDQFADFSLCNHVYSSFEDIQSKKRHSTFIHPFTKEDSDSFENIGDASKLPKRVVSDLLSVQKVAMCHFRYRVRQGSFTRVLTELDIEVGHDGRMEQPGPDIGSVPTFLSSRFTAD